MTVIQRYKDMNCINEVRRSQEFVWRIEARMEVAG